MCRLRPPLLVLALLTLFVNCYGQNQSLRADERPDISIRRIDFLNSAYHTMICTKELGKQGIGSVVQLQGGEFKNDDVYYGIVDNKVVYGDVNGDGQEDALVHIGCGEAIANFGYSELFIYTLQNGHPSLLAGFDDDRMEREYHRFYPRDLLWRITDDGVSVANGNLVITRFAGGSHACPKSVVTFEYHVARRQLQLNHRPRKRPAGLPC